MHTKIQPSTYEETLLHIMRKLPPERIVELVDFARFLEFQVAKDDDNGMAEDEHVNKSAVRAGDEKWEQLVERPEGKRVMREMAREALEDYQAGRTTDISSTDDGRLAPA